MSQARTPKPLTQKALDRIAFGLQIAHELRLAIKTASPSTGRILEALAGRIELCNQRENTVLITSDIRDIWRISQGYHTRLWRCGSKLCPDCLARQCRVTRNRLTRAIASVRLNRHERWSFVTFTIPNPGLSLVETRSIVNRAWTLFRKRKLCASLIRGGSKSEEFTVTRNGIHYHLHCLFVSKFLLYNEVRRVWTECVETAFEEHERPFKCNNADGLLSVNIQRVNPDAGTVRELCKYVTKSDSWSKIPKSDLADVAMINRWHRMFELFGCLSHRGTQRAADEKTILDTEDLSDGSHRAARPHWRAVIAELPPHRYLQELELEVFRRRELRTRRLIALHPLERIYNLACI